MNKQELKQLLAILGCDGKPSDVLRRLLIGLAIVLPFILICGFCGWLQTL